MRAGGDGLIERGGELAAADRALESVEAGDGRIIAVDGPPGIGKSVLVDAIRESARDRGFSVHSARGSELEIDFPFGVVRQLFERAVQERADVALAGAAEPAGALFRAEEAEGPAGNVSFSVLHGLYWMTLNLAGDEPVLLAVDDLHWADRSSLRFLAYLAHRLEGSDVGLLTAHRSTEPGTDPALIGAITADPRGVALHPKPLTVEGVGELVERRFERSSEEQFSRACERASGGNPLLLRQALDAVVAEGREPVAREADAIVALGPRGVSATVLNRLHGLPEEAATVARAIATLGDGTDLKTVAALTDRSPDEIVATTGDLSRAGILAPGPELGFVHPLVRSAVVEESPPGERQLAHARAASLMHEAGATPERIAAQLLAAPPVGEQWAAEVLDRAAALAASSGATEAAVTYLTRRIEEPIDVGRRPGTILELGMAEAGTGGPHAVERLQEAYDTLEQPEMRVVAAYALARVLLFVGEAQRASEVARTAREELAAEAPDLIAIVESVELISIYFGAEVAGAEERFRVLRELPDDPTPGQAVLAAAASYDWIYRGGTAAECSGLASEAIERAQQLEVDTGLTWIVATVVLVAAERPEAMDLWGRALARSHQQGSMFGVLSVHLWRGFTQLQQGELQDAEDSLRAGVEQISLMGGATLEYAYGLLASTLLAQGRVEDAERALGSIGRPAGIGDGALLWKVAEIELLLARGRDEEALAGAEAHVELCGWRLNPAFAPGRQLQASALLRLGRRDEAVAVLEQDLRLAEGWGSPGVVGRSLARLGEARGEEGIEEIERGIELLEASPLRLDLALALGAYGGTLRRAGRRSDARDPLRRAYELAEQCGAEAVAADIRAELHATGARPRSSALSGPDSLTASERRVADLAASGRTNKEIAQELFVTPKTVEVHLSNSYRKLDISGRRELPAALA